MHSPTPENDREVVPVPEPVSEPVPEDAADPGHADEGESGSPASQIPDESGGGPFSGGSAEPVGLEEHHQMQQPRRNREIERIVDGPLPDLSRLDEKDAFIQSQPLTMLIHDAFVQQKEHLLDRIGHLLLLSFPAFINVYRSFPLLKYTWPVIKDPDEAAVRYLFFMMIVLLVGVSSVLWSILFFRVLEMRDVKYIILLGVLLIGTLMLQEYILVGGAQFVKSLEIDW
ncbi:MAG TPA: hypothetical protein PKM25_07590 [Candidatus Ozemobacteraceae bacterium]|mgnify:CR=1 FL=1|nr:hypothetical protein [Candidatus Ozemobacteraceae bacterium]